MAKPIMCNGPDGGPAAVLITMTADGETLGLCGECLVDWAAALVAVQKPELFAPPPKQPARPRPRKAATSAPPAASGGKPPGAERTSLSGQDRIGREQATVRRVK